MREISKKGAEILFNQANFINEYNYTRNLTFSNRAVWGCNKKWTVS